MCVGRKVGRKERRLLSADVDTKSVVLALTRFLVVQRMFTFYSTGPAARSEHPWLRSADRAQAHWMGYF